MIGYIAIILSTIIWALAAERYGALSRSHSYLVINWWRCLFGLILNVFVMAAFHNLALNQDGLAAFHLNVRCVLLAISASVASYGIADYFLFKSINQIGAPMSLALGNTAPFWVLFFSWLFLKGEIDLRIVIGTIFICTGAVTYFIGLNSNSFPVKVRSMHLSRLKGVCFGWCVAIFWSLNALMGAELSNQLGSLYANVMRLFMGLVILSFVSLCRNIKIFSIPSGFLKSNAFFFWLEGGIATSLTYYAYSRLDVLICSAIEVCSPIVAFALQFLSKSKPKLIFSELMSVLMLCVGLLLLILK